MDLTEAYRECERITWTQARNFAYGIRLLPADKRRGLAVIYAFARRIDDIGDGTMPPEEKITALEQARGQVLDLSQPSVSQPTVSASTVSASTVSASTVSASTVSASMGRTIRCCSR